MKIHIIGIALGVMLAVPTIAFGSSFISSLIQGKTPNEAISVIGDQVDSLFNRVSEIESEQEELVERIGSLEEKENEEIQDASGTESVKEEYVEPELFQFTFDAETQNLCDKALAESEPSSNSVKGQISALCVRAQDGWFENKEGFNEVVLAIHEKAELLAEINAAYGE